MEMMEKRLATKNGLIISLEENCSTLTKKIYQLQEEIISLKLHNSRLDDSLISASVTERNDGVSKESQKQITATPNIEDRSNVTRLNVSDNNAEGNSTKLIFINHHATLRIQT